MLFTYDNEVQNYSFLSNGIRLYKTDESYHKLKYTISSEAENNSQVILNVKAYKVGVDEPVYSTSKNASMLSDVPIAFSSSTVLRGRITRAPPFSSGVKLFEIVRTVGEPTNLPRATFILSSGRNTLSTPSFIKCKMSGSESPCINEGARTDLELLTDCTRRFSFRSIKSSI